MSTSCDITRTINEGANAESSLEDRLELGGEGTGERGKCRVYNLQGLSFFPASAGPFPAPSWQNSVSPCTCSELCCPFSISCMKTNKIVSWQIPSKVEDFEMAKCPGFVPPLPAGEN